jgi:hypothetical protein
MARAGYDPRDLARMFAAIERESQGNTPPQWMSSHTKTRNRQQYNAQEAEKLRIGPRADIGGFSRVKSRFASLPAARSMGDLAKAGGGSGGGRGGVESTGTIGQPVPSPSAQYKTARGGQLFQVSVPSNWTGISSNNAVKFVPRNALGEYQGQSVFTHGVELGVTRPSSRNLEEATDAFVTAIVRGNPGMRSAGAQRQVRISQRAAIGTPLVGRSALNYTERVGIYTTFLADGSLFYYLTVAPEDDAAVYDETFDRVGSSIRLNDR